MEYSVLSASIMAGPEMRVPFSWHAVVNALYHHYNWISLSFGLIYVISHVGVTLCLGGIQGRYWRVPLTQKGIILDSISGLKFVPA